MGLKAEKGVFATLVVTPVTGGSKRIDGLEAIRSYLAGLEMKAMLDRALLGSKDNPHDTGAPALKRGYYTLHPRVLNDYSLPKSFRDEAKRVFTGELKADYITQVYSSDDVLLVEVKPNGKGQFYRSYRVPVRCSGWYGGGFVNVSANDLIKQDTGGVAWSVGVKAERRLYRQWKDAQLKEAKNLTKKRIMKTLAGPADAPFKFGDRLKVKDGRWPDSEIIFIGYFRGGSVIILEDGDVVQGTATSYIKA